MSPQVRKRNGLAKLIGQREITDMSLRRNDKFSSIEVKISCSLSRASERGLQLSLLGKSLRGLGGKSIQTQRVGVTKTVGHAPGLYGVRRQAKRDAALA